MTDIDPYLTPFDNTYPETKPIIPSTITRSMTRYNGPTKNKRKNCLITIRRGDYIYFGIARCNLKADKYERDKGYNIAMDRALDAMDNEPRGVSSYVDTHGVYGKYRDKDAKNLIRYFEKMR